MGPEDIRKMKNVEKISMLTCYDYSFAKAMDGRVDVLLVGDSLGNVVLGKKSTREVKQSDMLRCVDAVRCGVKKSLIIADLAFDTYNDSYTALKNARQLINAGANAVKPEGRADIVRALVNGGIQVCGHVGLLPQSSERMTVQGKNEQEAKDILEQARQIEKAGAFMLIIETVPSSLAERISHELDIPVIGIGAGAECDGQVLVSYDMLGIFNDFKPKFVRRYAELDQMIGLACESFSKDVKKGDFPSNKERFE